MRTRSFKVFAVFFSVFAYIIWLILYDYFETVGSNASLAQRCIISWLGIIVFFAYFFIWRWLTGKYITLFSLFLIFFTLFNFGQSFLWAFGIHTTLRNEIGNGRLYDVVAYDNSVTIRAQLMYIICYITLNLGAILVWKKNDRGRFISQNYDWSGVEEIKLRKLYVTSAIILSLAFPATFYIAIRNFIIGQRFSYHDLYYGNVGSIPTVISILDGCFFPALLGVLIGNKYERKTRKIIYTIFFAYAVITLLCGDRGEWINKLAVLIWADIWFYKKIETKKFFLSVLLGFLGIYLITPFVELRNVGLSWDGIIGVYSSISQNPIISMLVEFGHSMGITMVLINSDVQFPFGNSYLMSFLTIFSTRWAEILFGIKYTQVSTWFSSDYLHILYGADFSIIGEAILNYGIHIAPVIIGVLGVIISKISLLPLNPKKAPLVICLSIAAMEPILKMSRSIFWYPLTRCAYFVVIFIFAYTLVSLHYRRRS